MLMYRFVANPVPGYNALLPRGLISYNNQAVTEPGVVSRFELFFRLVTLVAVRNGFRSTS